MEHMVIKAQWYNSSKELDRHLESWLCGYCGSLNIDENAKCERCNASREEGIVCKHCGGRTEPGLNCERCGAPIPKLVSEDELIEFAREAWGENPFTEQFGDETLWTTRRPEPKPVISTDHIGVAKEGIGNAFAPAIRNFIEWFKRVFS